MSKSSNRVDRLSLNVEDQLLVALEYWREYRRKRFGLRLHLIAGLLNYELAHAS
jgi:hypothetical protein